MTIGRFWLLTGGVALAACGARSTPGRAVPAGDEPDSGDQNDAGPFVPGEDSEVCCDSGPDLEPTARRLVFDGPECGLPLAADHLIENCGTERVASAVLVQVFAGNPTEPEHRVLRELWTEPGMPAGMGQWLFFELSAEEWASAVEEFPHSGRHYYLVADPAGEIEECRELNNRGWFDGPCP